MNEGLCSSCIKGHFPDSGVSRCRYLVKKNELRNKAIREIMEGQGDDRFSPAGLKVLVVDDDLMCLKVVSAMLKRCNYEVNTVSNGQQALAELRAKQGAENQYDLVLSDVYMPDMDGFKLLENIGLELEIPVIMMSSDSDTNVVLRGVTHGAVDFLIKPVRIEELRNVWQHVIRRRSVTFSRCTADESGGDHESDAQTGQRMKRKESDVIRAEHEGGAGGKKPRVVWSVEMHQQFVYAVNALGIDKAVPKRILDLMNVEGLTRENVASHLQKYRLYLKRVESVAGKDHPQMGRGRAVEKGSGKPPLQKSRASKSSATLENIDQESARKATGMMHTCGSTPNLQGYSTPWMAHPYPPQGYYQISGAMYGGAGMMVNPTSGQPMGWHQQNNIMGGVPPGQYNAMGSTMFYQSAGNSLGSNGVGIGASANHAQNNNVSSVMDTPSSQMPALTETGVGVGSSATGNVLGIENDFDSMATNDLNLQSSSIVDSQNNVDLVSDFMRAGSGIVNEKDLPNIQGLENGNTNDDHGTEVLDMFIKGMDS